MEISSNGASLKIVDGTNVVNVIKANILFVEVIKTNIIKIDIGAGPLHNFFVSFPDVTVPVTANPGALRDAILEMLLSGTGNTGNATEANQLAEIAALNNVVTTLNAINIGVTDKTFDEPLLMDDGQAHLIYKGYALIGSKGNQAVWAIQKIQHIAGTDVVTWANGNKNFTNVWNDREALTYN